MSPRLAKVISRSATGRSLRALASVVVIRPCWNSAVARFARMCRSWAGLPPRRWPLVGVGIRTSPCYPWRSTTSVLLGLHVALVVVAIGADRAARVEPGRRVLERQAHVNELLLDFLDRLGAEVPYVEQILLAAADELADRVNALALQAVVGTDG